MIVTLDALPALTHSWIAPLQSADPELYAELAETIVVSAPGASVGCDFPAEVATVLGALDLSGKEIGIFRFAPVEGDDAAAKISIYNQMMRLLYDAPPDLVFLGDYGAGNLFAAPQGVGLFDAGRDHVTALAPNFSSFLLAQANAFDAYKRHIVKARDEVSYNAERDQVAGSPRFADTDVAAIFAAQLRG